MQMTVATCIKRRQMMACAHYITRIKEHFLLLHRNL